MSKGKQPKTRVNKVPKLFLSEIKDVPFNTISK